MLAGMAPGQQAVVREFTGTMRLYVPIVHPRHFDVAVSYLVRRLEENSAPQNFLYALFAPEEQALKDQEEVFREAVEQRWDTFAGPRRTQNRLEEAEQAAGRQAPRTGRFTNEADTDPALAPNRQWAQEALKRNPGEHGIAEVTDPTAVEGHIARAKELGTEWGKRPAAERAALDGPA